MEFFQGSYMPMKLIRLFWYVGQTLDVLDPLIVRKTGISAISSHPVSAPSSRTLQSYKSSRTQEPVSTASTALHGLGILCISSRRTDSRIKGGKQEPKWSYLYIGESGRVKKLQYVR